MTKRILLLTGEFPPFAGGIANAAVNLARALVKEGCSVSVVAPTYKRSDKEFDRCEPYRIYRLPMMRLRYVRMLPMAPVILAIALKERPEFILAMRATREGMIALTIKKLLGIPFLVFAHGLEFARFNPNSLSWRICRQIYKQTEAILANSGPTQAILAERGFDKGKVHIVHWGVSDQIFEPVQPLTNWNGQSFEGKRVILSVSRLVERKGVDKVIEALPFVLEQCPDAMYVVVGDGPYREQLMQLAQERGVADKVLFAGRVPDIRPFYHTCDVFVLPTREGRKGDIEGLGLVYLEAAACGKPVVASLVGGVADAVVPNETALIVDPLDPKDIANAIVKVLTDKELARKLGEAGRERVLREFTYDKVAAKVLQIVAQVEKQRSKSNRQNAR
jgi:phosphatidylinositol alpha-1,6-mannosyltransferase